MVDSPVGHNETQQGRLRVAVIGGGAAGHMAAISAKRAAPLATVWLLEKSSKWLSKVLISGGGRCNVTHNCSDPRKLAQNYPRGGPFLRQTFSVWGQPETLAWFAEHGVRLKAEADGRMFPESNDSRTVSTALQRAALDLGVVLRANCGVSAIERTGCDWLLGTTSGPLVADRVIIATGGSPKDEGLKWLREIGHETVPAVPSLFSFNLPDAPIRALSGVSLPNVRVKIAGTKLTSMGPLLITHWGLSGPAVLRLSAFGARILHERGYKYEVIVDWLGDLGEPDARELMRRGMEEHPKRQMQNSGPFGLPARLWLYLLDRAGIVGEKPAGDLGKRSIDRLMDVLINDRYPADGRTTFKEEFVTAGGIALHQVDPRTLQSSVAPGIYFAGEVLDVDGITGGFNFQAAWSTGWLAGAAAVGMAK